MFRCLSFWVKLLIIIAATALYGCVADSSTRNKTSTNVSRAITAPIELDKLEADSVQATDIINRSKKHVKRSGETYLMRGLANVFSRGIDDMAIQLRQNGYDAANFSYTQWPQVAQDIVVRASRKKVSYPVIIIGHSLGANESSKFANYLASNNVDVGLVIAFDPVETGSVGKGIKKVVNYYLPKSADKRIGASSKSSDNRIHAANDFKGNLQNIDVSTDSTVTHVNVDKYPPYQTATLNSIAELTRKLKKRATKSAREGSR